MWHQARACADAGAFADVRMAADAMKRFFANTATTLPPKITDWTGAPATSFGAYNSDGLPADLSGTVDRVMIMRQVHNMHRLGMLYPEMAAVRRLLKPGGLLCIEEHRAKLITAKGDYAGANPEDPDEYKAENVFWVPADARWSHLQASAKQPTIGKIVDDAMVAIERDNPRLKGVLPKDYARPGLDKQRLGQIILECAADERPASALPAGSRLGVLGIEVLTFLAHGNHLSAPESSGASRLSFQGFPVPGEEHLCPFSF